MSATAIASGVSETRWTAKARTRPALAGEVVVLVGLLFVYDRLRTLTPIERSRAVRHGFDLIHAEGAFAWERGFNHWFAGHPLVDALAVSYYQFAHIGAAFTVLAWCYVRRPDVYRPARTALVATNIVGLAWFALYPAAPPRLLPDGGFIDLVARAGFGSSHGPIPIDAYAAMPSLHLAWAVCIAMTGLAVTRSVAIRALFVLHPIVTGVIVVGTGNHYLADVAAGAALGFVACVCARVRRSHCRDSATLPVHPGRDRFTLVSFHAHPDDETLLTGGTLARAAAEGHRVVIVVATLGEAGLTGQTNGPTSLADRRLGELRQAVAELDCARLAWLGYADSGRMGEVDGPRTFAAADADEAASRLAQILSEEDADLLTTYDAAGGYGHPDHVRVHDIGARAAVTAGTPVVLEATVDRRSLLRLTRVLRLVPRLPDEFRPERIRSSFTPHAQLTHRVDVRAFADHKRAAMRAHASQTSGGDGPRSLALFLRLPRPLFRWCFGTEWYVERGAFPSRSLSGDPFATLRADVRPGHDHVPMSPPRLADSIGPTRLGPEAAR